MNRVLGICVLLTIVHASDYFVQLSSDSPVIRGGTVHFKAQVYEGGEKSDGWFKYKWNDNGIPEQRRTFESNSSLDTWNVTYAADTYPPGPYEMQVVVYKFILLVYYPITSQRMNFNLSDVLNGEMELIQNNKTLSNTFVSSAVALNHTIKLKEGDMDFLHEKATSIMTYWFIDCKFAGISNDFSFAKRYNTSNELHTIEGLVVAGFEPITTLPPATTTVPTTAKPNSTTAKPNVLPSNSSAVLHNINSSILPSKKIVTRSIKKMLVEENELPFNGTFPFICGNSSVVPMDPKNTYGYFRTKITVKDPVSNITVTGNNWLEHGDILSLQVKCNGSGAFNYCVHFHSEKYNITGNETCIVPDTSEKCEFPIKRFFIEAKPYTIVIVVYNDVNKLVSPVTVTVYKVTKQAQLSVIVVPVVFSFIAVILMVFGVAYYVQHRSRFTVEVADFNFGRAYSDLEYKTFKERLRDSIANSFTRGPSPGSSEVPVWPPGKKYGSMT